MPNLILTALLLTGFLSSATAQPRPGGDADASIDPEPEPLDELMPMSTPVIRFGTGRGMDDSDAAYNTFDPSGVPSADVVVALGVKPESAFQPSYGMLSNLATAVYIFQQGKASFLMVCGGYTMGHIAEAEMMKILAIAMGVPAGRIVVENGSFDTNENAANAAVLATRRNLLTGILVAQPGHIQRAAGTFMRYSVFGQLFPVVAANMDTPFKSCGLSGELPHGRFDAIVVHGFSPEYNFTMDPLDVPSQLVASLALASGLYAQKLADRVLLWHRAEAWGHISRTEMMAIILAAMGVPVDAMVLASARRYVNKNRALEEMLSSSKVRRVVAIIPEDPDGALENAREAYRKAGVEVRFIRSCNPG